MDNAMAAAIVDAARALGAALCMGIGAIGNMRKILVKMYR